LVGNHNSSGGWCNSWISQYRVYFILLYILFFSSVCVPRRLWSLYMSTLCIVRTVLWEKSRSFYWLAHDRFDSGLFHPVIARYICEYLCVEIGYHKLVKKVTCHAEINQSSVIVITHISKPMRAHYFSEVVIINFPSWSLRWWSWCHFCVAAIVDCRIGPFHYRPLLVNNIIQLLRYGFWNESAQRFGRRQASIPLVLFHFCGHDDLNSISVRYWVAREYHIVTVKYCHVTTIFSLRWNPWSWSIAGHFSR